MILCSNKKWQDYNFGLLAIFWYAVEVLLQMSNIHRWFSYRENSNLITHQNEMRFQMGLSVSHESVKAINAFVQTGKKATPLVRWVTVNCPLARCVARGWKAVILHSLIPLAWYPCVGYRLNNHLHQFWLSSIVTFQSEF